MDVRRVPAVVRGSGHHRLVLVAAGLAVLLAATVLAALAGLTEKAVEGGVQRRLAADPAAVVEVSGGYRAAGGRELDRDARSALDRAYGGVAHHTWSALRAPSARSTELPVVEAAGRPRADATVAVVALEGAGRHAELVSGRRPRVGGDPETVLNEVLASELGVRAGDSLTVRTADKKRLRLRVCGLYRTGDRSPALWASVASAFGTPDTIALVPREVITDNAGLSPDASELWLGVPDAGRLRIDDIGPLARRVEGFSGSDVSLSVYRGRTPTTRLAVVPGLENALDELGTSVAVARAGLYVPATLLAALAATALVLTARQLAEHRRPELALHAARGAGTPRIAASTAGLWASVALPAGLAAPFLAGPLMGLLGRAGLVPGGVPESAAAATGWAAVLLVVLLHGAAVLVPTVRAVRDRRAVSRLRLRVGRFAGAQRAGADLALAAVAVLGWTQLRQYRSSLSGSGGVDPVLVLAPVA
ncbi:hypothetical protein [Streptomyces sp. NPDC048527]|uniref:hypothetical protein n=1 Tax=Streptomyces sp. NPDC048527 TaxID=3365568 RepID=UPI0037234528